VVGSGGDCYGGNLASGSDGVILRGRRPYSLGMGRHKKKIMDDRRLGRLIAGLAGVESPRDGGVVEVWNSDQGAPPGAGETTKERRAKNKNSSEPLHKSMILPIHPDAAAVKCLQNRELACAHVYKTAVDQLNHHCNLANGSQERQNVLYAGASGVSGAARKVEVDRWKGMVRRRREVSGLIRTARLAGDVEGVEKLERERTKIDEGCRRLGDSLFGGKVGGGAGADTPLAAAFEEFRKRWGSYKGNTHYFTRALLRGKRWCEVEDHVWGLHDDGAGGDILDGWVGAHLSPTNVCEIAKEVGKNFSNGIRNSGHGNRFRLRRGGRRHRCGTGDRTTSLNGGRLVLMSDGTFYLLVRRSGASRRIIGDRPENVHRIRCSLRDPRQDKGRQRDDLVHIIRDREVVSRVRAVMPVFHRGLWYVHILYSCRKLRDRENLLPGCTVGVDLGTETVSVNIVDDSTGLTVFAGKLSTVEECRGRERRLLRQQKRFSEGCRLRATELGIIREGGAWGEGKRLQRKFWTARVRDVHRRMKRTEGQIVEARKNLRNRVATFIGCIGGRLFSEGGDVAGWAKDHGRGVERGSPGAFRNAMFVASNRCGRRSIDLRKNPMKVSEGHLYLVDQKKYRATGTDIFEKNPRRAYTKLGADVREIVRNGVTVDRDLYAALNLSHPNIDGTKINRDAAMRDFKHLYCGTDPACDDGGRQGPVFGGVIPFGKFVQIITDLHKKLSAG